MPLGLPLKSPIPLVYLILPFIPFYFSALTTAIIFGWVNHAWTTTKFSHFILYSKQLCMQPHVVI